MTAALPAGASGTYERLRAAVLQGRADVRAMAAIVFHGVWHGLAVLGACGSPERPALPAAHDRQLVRQLADMVLAVESQVQHVY